MLLCYARLVARETSKVTFPALTSIYLEDWIYSITRAAAEEQVHGLGSNPAARRRCRFGCNADENAYHTISACAEPEFTTRHDEVVFHILQAILTSTEAPEQIKSQLRFGKAALVTEHTWRDRRVKIRAGIKFQTDPELYHNRPDIVISLSNPAEIYIFEIAVSHLQNIRVQEELKRVRYTKNSTVPIRHQNFKDVPRTYNICEALGRMYRGPVKFGVLVLGALGEILNTDDHKGFTRHLKKLGSSEDEIKRLLIKSSVSVCKSTAKIIMKRL